MNLYEFPKLPFQEEAVTILAKDKNIRIERIINTGTSQTGTTRLKRNIWFCWMAMRKLSLKTGEIFICQKAIRF